MGMPAPDIQMQPSLLRELRGWRGDAAGPGFWGASPVMTLEMGREQELEDGARPGGSVF